MGVTKNNFRHYLEMKIDMYFLVNWIIGATVVFH